MQITIEAMESDVDEIALQGIEFWSTVCDEEVDLAIELSEVSRFMLSAKKTKTKLMCVCTEFSGC